jgi:N-acyl-D-amino-acid deacylase
MADCVLVGGTVVDGSGGPSFLGTVCIEDGRISELISPGGHLPLGPQIDVTGLVISPGFIDMHAHSDLAVVYDPLHTAKVWQGVTLEVLGQDGLSYAPVTDDTLVHLLVQLAGWNGTPESEPEWRSVGEYLARIDQGSAVNVAYLVPHGTVRLAVLDTEDRKTEQRGTRAHAAVGARGPRPGCSGPLDRSYLYARHVRG